jgi:DNA helicase-2/ATP-dependent DNA helicase PcrA
VPAFRVMTDRTLHAIAAASPGSLQQLQRLQGVGPKLVERHGRALLELLSRGAT